MPEKQFYSYHEIEQKLSYLKGSFERDELQAISDLSKRVARGELGLDSLPEFRDNWQDIEPEPFLRRARYERGLLIIDEILNPSKQNKRLDDVLSARVFYDDNYEEAIEVTYR
jgi:hypothetical protein